MSRWYKVKHAKHTFTHSLLSIYKMRRLTARHSGDVRRCSGAGARWGLVDVSSLWAQRLSVRPFLDIYGELFVIECVYWGMSCHSCLYSGEADLHVADSGL